MTEHHQGEEKMREPGWLRQRFVPWMLAGLFLCAQGFAETLEVRVSAGSDDMEELTSDGSADPGSSDLELCEEYPGDPDDVQNQVVGIRFQNVTVPADATITAAYIQFAVDETKGDDTVANVTIEGIADGRPRTFSGEAGEIANRTRTAASVPWDIPVWATVGEAGADQRTPDLTDIVTEIVGNDGWVLGNPMAFVITGTGTRTAESYDGDADLAPLLHIEYDMPSADLFRLAWTEDPTSTMTIGWRNLSGTDPHVMYGLDPGGADFGRADVDTVHDYFNAARDEDIPANHLVSQFVTLRDLSPDTAYYFQVVNSDGSSPIMWFKTAPDTPSDFTFIAGGDSRTNDEPRFWGMQLVAKIRPLFIVYGGDYMDDGTYEEWLRWLSEWQSTRSADGRMYPIIPQHGNHENDVTDMVQKIFNITNPDAYGTLGFGGDQFRVWALNTELEPGVGYGAFQNQTQDAWDAQTAWLAQELADPANAATWQVASYHRPLRPHTSGKPEGQMRYDDWAQVFYDNGLDVSIESDTHMTKYTFPVAPGAGEGSFMDFVRDDANGTVYLGEGSWGAPTRPTDDDKIWTLGSESFWQFKLIHVDSGAEDRMDVRTVRFGAIEEYNQGIVYDPGTVTSITQAEQDADPFAMPAGLDLWKPLAGEVYSIYPNGTGEVFRGADVDGVELVPTGSEWSYLDDGTDQGTAWTATDFDDAAWGTGAGEFGYGDGDEVTELGFGGDPDNKYTTYYFRKDFEVADPSRIVRLVLYILRDDGAVVYLNGAEVARHNMPDGDIAYNTFASGAVGGGAESQYYEISLLPEAVVAGANTIAVEVHQADAGSSDLSFNLGLVGVTSDTTEIDAPAAPTDLAAEALSVSEIQLTWTDNADNEVYQQLERSTDGGATWMVHRPRIKPGVTTFLDDSLEEGATYHYRLRAYNAGGLSGHTDEIVATTLTNPVPVVLSQDFDLMTFGDWQNVNVASNHDWYIGERDGRIFAEMNGYGADAPSDDWIISPPIHFDFYTEESLNFMTAKNYDGGGMVAVVSTDYDGAGDPTNFTWEEVPATYSAGSYAWENSGDVDLTGFTGVGYVAFRYTSTGTGGGDGALWRVDDIVIRGKYDPPAIIPLEDFNIGSLGTWTAYDRASDGPDVNGWDDADWHPENRADQDGAICNGFGADMASDDWLISPTMQIAAQDNAVFAFDMYTKYGGPQLEALASTNYSGAGDPLATGVEWTSLGMFEGLYDAWESHEVFLGSQFVGDTVHVAFRYTSVGTGGGDGRRHGVDNLVVAQSLAPPPMTVDFTVTKEFVAEGEDVQFTGMVTNGTGPFTYDWDFGDGSTDTGETVTHSYAAEGLYTVTLTVTDTATEETAELVKPTYVEVFHVTAFRMPAPSGEVRIATFNCYLNRSAEGDLLADLQAGDDEQVAKVAEILQRVRPDVVLLNEFDYVEGGAAVDLFQANYLAVSQNGQAPIDYPYYFLAPSNTGEPSSHDFDNDGQATGTGNDAYGYGEFPGQYAMVLLSRYPIDHDAARTFQTFLWKDMPNAMLPDDPDTPEPMDWYTPEELNDFRLSSKSHWDVPVMADGRPIHVLCSHPTPPVFDGPEDRNGTRNYDEIRFWTDYVDPAVNDYFYDDDGAAGGLPEGARFVILGDQNSSRFEGDATLDAEDKRAIEYLLDSSYVNQQINGSYNPASLGGPENDPGNEYAVWHTADWKMQADYVLPSAAGTSVYNSGVFWPTRTDDLYYLVGPNVQSSDHRLVWVDLALTFPQSVASGDPTAESVILWTRVQDVENPGDLSLSVEVATDMDFQNVVATRDDLVARANFDHCVKAKIEGLDSYTTYYYRFLYDGIHSPVGRTKTLPAEGENVNYKFAYFTCQDYIGRYYNVMLDVVQQDDIDAMVFLGDYIYETTGDPGFQSAGGARDIMFEDTAGAIELHSHEGEAYYAAQSLSNYRDLYKTYRTDPVLRRAHELFPIMAIWDDHEYSDDCWQDVATYFDGRQDEMNTLRRQSAEHAFFEYLPTEIGMDATGVSIDESILYPNAIIYKTVNCGANLDLIMTDYRSFRPDHLIAEDAFPSTIVIDQPTLEGMLAGMGMTPEQIAGTVATMEPYIDIDDPEHAQLKLVVTGVVNLLYQSEGLSEIDAAAKAAQVVSGNLGVTFLAGAFEAVQQDVPLTLTDTGDLPKGLSYLYMGKMNLFSSLGARYMVVRDTYKLYAAYRAMLDADSQNVLAARQNETGVETTQETWLGMELQSSSAAWKVVGSSVSMTPMDIDLGNPDLVPPEMLPPEMRQAFSLNVDQWAGVPNYRQAIVDMLADHNAVVIAGDIHASFISKLYSTDGKVVPDFTGPAISSGSFGDMLRSNAIGLLGDSPEVNALIDNIAPVIDYTVNSGSEAEILDLDVFSHGYVVIEATPDKLMTTYRRIAGNEVFHNHYANGMDMPVQDLFSTHEFEVTTGDNGLELNERAEPLSLTILHNNDGESKLVNAGAGNLALFGGASRFKATVDRERTVAEGLGRQVLVLSSGDNFMPGTAREAGEANGVDYDAMLVDAVGYDASALGNHDWDQGPDELQSFIENTPNTGPYLSCNTDFSAHAGLQGLVDAGRIAPSTVIQVGDHQVGVVGATTFWLESISSPAPAFIIDADDDGDKDLDDVIQLVQAEVDALTDAGVKIVILAAHMQSVEFELQMATQLSNVDLIVAGGGHELLANDGDALLRDAGYITETVYGPYPMVPMIESPDGSITPVVTTSGNYRYLGVFDVEFDADGRLTGYAGYPARVSGTGDDAVTPDATMQADVVEPIEAFIEELNAQVIGVSDVALNGVRSHVRTRETNEGNLIADALRWQANQIGAQYGAPMADIAIQNGGGIRNDSVIPAGDFTEGLTYDILPFANFVVTIPDVTPHKLLEIFENASSSIEYTSGRFAQVSGVRVRYNVGRPAGERVVDIVLEDGTVIVENGHVIRGAPNVNIATIDFLATGGDSYPYENMAFFTFPVSYREALSNYIQDGLAGVITGDMYPEGGDGRITIESYGPGPQASDDFTHDTRSTVALSGAEITAFDPLTDRLFVTHGSGFSVVDVSDPANLMLVGEIGLNHQPEDEFGVQSLAVSNGILAVAVADEANGNAGQIRFYNTDMALPILGGDGHIQMVEVGNLPDMVTFTNDGSKLLVACEGEPVDATDPLGAVSIVDMTAGVDGVTVTTAGFEAFNGREEELRNRGVRIFPGKTVAEDVEPEYIAVSADDTLAFVVLQEANAFGVLDLTTDTIVDVLPCGLKDHSHGPIKLTNYPFADRPVLGTTDGGTEILLGGFSGLWFEGETDTGNLSFLTIPDRGPQCDKFDLDEDGEDERPFALPDYQARVVRFELNPETGDVAVTEQIMLTRPDGTTPITGVSNIEGVDEEPVDLYGNPLNYDPMGGDFEGIVTAPDGSWWMCDEYRPAIYHFGADGVMIARYVADGTAALAGGTPGDYGTETLPPEYARRRANRGFEGIAYDTDNDVVYAMIQTPMYNPDSSTKDNSDVIRILGINAADGAAVAEYVYLLERNKEAGHSLARTDKIGDMVYAGGGKFMVIERDSSREPTGKKYIFEVDLKGATNMLLLGAPFLPDGETLEQQTADSLAGLGIVPVHKTKKVNLCSVGYHVAGDKPEGLALLPDGVLAVLNDNDFGLEDNTPPENGQVVLAANPIIPTLGILEPMEGNKLDSSDKDGVINLANRPLYGMYMADGMAAFHTSQGQFFITANEGDARDEDKDLEDVTLDETAFPNAANLQDRNVMGRIGVSTIDGDLDGDGSLEKIVAYGARSFSIWDIYGNQVFDSGDDIARITANCCPDLFNADDGEFDKRSDNKGAEPEGITVGMISGRTVAFVGLERATGGVLVYDVSMPAMPEYLGFLNNAGDLAPEGLTFIDVEDSPSGKPLLITSNEDSNTVTAYELQLTGPIPMPRHPTDGQVVADEQPVLQWGPASDAEWYHVVVRAGETTVVDEWTENTHLMVGPLTSGNYTWFVQGWSDEGGFAPWSHGASFTVHGPELPPMAPQCVSPSGEIAELRPTLTWTEAAGAKWYNVYILRNEETYFERWTQDTEFPVFWDLPSGEYRWGVVAWNDAGFSGWSDPMTFSLPAATPQAPTPVAPSAGETNDLSPSFEWSPVAQVDWYHLYIERDGAKYYELWLQSTEFQPWWAFEAGNYEWWVSAWHPEWAGEEQSVGTAFTVTPIQPGPATLTAPSGDVAVRRPEFHWEKAAGAAWYQIYIMHNNQHYYDTWTQRTEFTPYWAMENGDYVWYVRTWGPVGGFGDWSDPMYFTVNVTPLAGPTLLAPLGTWEDPVDVTFQWQPVTGATHYYLEVALDGEFYYANWLEDSSYTAWWSLASGAYEWQVTAWSETLEFGNTSSVGSFTIPPMVP